MMIYLALALAAVAGFILGRWYNQPKAQPTKEQPPTLVRINADEALRHANRNLGDRVRELEAICADIHASTVNSQSGTARMVARKASAGLPSPRQAIPGKA